MDADLKKVAFSAAGASRSSVKPVLPADGKAPEDPVKRVSKHLRYLYKVNLPHHPVRMRHLPLSDRRLLLYGHLGYQEIALSDTSHAYSLQNPVHWQTQMCDCIQTSDLFVYIVSLSHHSAAISCFDGLMSCQRFAEVQYPLGCVSSLATNSPTCSHLFGTNSELNCVLKFLPSDLTLSKAERFGSDRLWRPFDCCTSQEFPRRDGTRTQFLFVSNIDAGISVIDLNTMRIVEENADDLLPGAKYLAYDQKRNLLFMSISCERRVRCYKFEPNEAMIDPWLQKVGDFLVANRKPIIRSTGPQCIMWDSGTDQLGVISWSQSNGDFVAKSFKVNV